MFYLPQIQRLSIKNYDLYDMPLNIEFDKPLTIIYGTNGTGKSTLMQIILFSIMGPYKAGLKVTTRLEVRRDVRPLYDASFFVNRTKDKQLAQSAVVEIDFYLNNDLYHVVHSLSNCKLLDVQVNGKKIDGDVCSYMEYEKEFTSSRSISDDSNLKKYLIYQYQKSVANSSSLPWGFNTLIKMFTDILFFDERREYTFWDPSTQETVLGRYILDGKTYEKYVETKLKSKELESLYKKKSETYNFMRKFFDAEVKFEGNKTTINEQIEINKLDDKIKIFYKELENLKDEFKIEEKKYSSLYREHEDIISEINKLDYTWYSTFYSPKYADSCKKYIPFITNNKCPICGSKHEFDIELNDKCFFCNEKLVANDINFNEIDTKLKEYKEKEKKINNEIEFIKEEQRKLELSIGKKKKEIERCEERMREMKISSNVETDIWVKRDRERLEKAKKQREDVSLKLAENKKIETKLRYELEKDFLSSFRKYERQFKTFAYSFFGDTHSIELSVPFKTERILDKAIMDFSLDGQKRIDSDMLSESQRIFTDLAFRFATLTTYHENSFFLCETPDSTLDIIHEDNAANTLFEYIRLNKNKLIISANARTSRLIHDLVLKVGSDNTLIIDLTKISRLSLKTESLSFDKIRG